MKKTLTEALALQIKVMELELADMRRHYERKLRDPKFYAARTKRAVNSGGAL